ncbi:hypothetical protein [Candidatus Chromulinivorax destructor]|nr:hypothetical protein [Candidatus Chromulinivorax destructor]
MKKLFFISLLMMSSLVVAKPESEFEKFLREYSDARKHVAKHGTPLQKASIASTDIILKSVDVALVVGTCSYVVNYGLGSFEATKDLPNRGTVATGACASLYAALYAAYKYEEMEKSQEKPKVEEKQKSSSWF